MFVLWTVNWFFLSDVCALRHYPQAFGEFMARQAVERLTATWLRFCINKYTAIIANVCIRAKHMHHP